MSSWPDLLGFAGVFLVLLAYSLQQLRRIDGNGLLYPFVNFIGAGLILVSLVYKPNVPAIVMEAAWAVVSIIGIVFALKARQKTKQ
ncbi:MAG: CBU_0592 family membrane protein [Arenimonas sp.]